MYDISIFTEWFGFCPELKVGSYVAIKIRASENDANDEECKIAQLLLNKFIPKFYGVFIETETHYDHWDDWGSKFASYFPSFLEFKSGWFSHQRN